MVNQNSYWSKKPATHVARNAFAEECGAYLNGSESVLELGSGRGEDARHFLDLGCSVTAFDISQANVEHLQGLAREWGTDHLSVVQGDIGEKMPFNHSSFDAVYAHLSLHYFDDSRTKAVFADIHRILKPGGLLFVKCKSVDDPLYGKGERVGEDMYKHEHVRHFFSERYMRECLASFEILSLKKTASAYADRASAFIEGIARKKM